MAATLPRVVQWNGDTVERKLARCANDLDEHDNAIAEEARERKLDVQTLGQKLDRNTQALLALAASVTAAAIGIVAVLLTRGGH